MVLKKTGSELPDSDNQNLYPIMILPKDGNVTEELNLKF